MNKPVNLKTTKKLYINLDGRRWDETNGRRLLAQSEENRKYYETSKTKVKEAETALLEDAGYTKLQAELDYVQRRSRVRTITAEEIIRCLIDIEDELGVPKAAMEEITVDVDLNSENFPSAYKGRPESTQFCAIYRNGSWRITDIYRNYTRRFNQRVIVNHTETSKKALIDRFSVFVI